MTELLLDWSAGNPSALDRLAPLVYEELRRVARSHLRRERPGHLLQTTAALDERQSRIVELRCCGGLTAEVLDISPRTVRREWTLAKAWLYRQIFGGAGPR